MNCPVLTKFGRGVYFSLQNAECNDVVMQVKQQSLNHSKPGKSFLFCLRFPMKTALPKVYEKQVNAFYYVCCFLNNNLAQIGQSLKGIGLPQNHNHFSVGLLVNTPQLDHNLMTPLKGQMQRNWIHFDVKLK